MNKLTSIKRTEMKLLNHKILGLTAILIFGANNVWAADQSTGVVIGDTMIFSLFLLAAVVFLMIIYAQVMAMKSILENKDLWKNKEDKKSGGDGVKAGLIIGALALANQTFAQGAETAPVIVMTEQMYWIMIALNGFLLGIIVSLYYVLKGLLATLRGEEEQEETVVASFTASLTDAVPIEQEHQILLDHNYDGIRELDNNLPPWWKYGFYFTIIFAFVYLIVYHLLGVADLQTEEYNKEMAQAAIENEAFLATQASLVDESNLVALDDPTRLASGKAVFVTNCVVCHGPDGQGVVGPNLTDEYWKNGGGIKNVFHTIKVGVPEKGMISWESVLTPAQRLEVASYILTLKGTNPPNPKAPEGDIWVEEAAAPVQEVGPEVTDTLTK
jgi:cytochrome c oxidase cbb3-type subunit 3